MAQDRSTIDAILTEHFRYTPLSVIDDIINSINSIIYKALTALESGLLAQTPKNLGFADAKSSSKSKNQDKDNSSAVAAVAAATSAETARAEIENGTHALETLLEAAVDKNFDIFELFALQHIFTIDSNVLEHVRLKHYENVTWPLTDSDVLPEKITRARRDLRREREIGLILERENSAMDNVLGQLRSLVGEQGSLGGILGATTTATGTADDKSIHKRQSKAATAAVAASSSSIDSRNRLSTTAQFTTSQLPGLKILLNDLRSKIALLPANAEELKTRNIAGSTSDEQRKRYVETVAKRAVRENLGIGERDEADLARGLGPQRSGAEVRALERLLGRNVRAGGAAEMENEREDDEDDDDEEDD